MKRSLTIIVMLATACGAKPTVEVSVPQNAQAVATEANLPTCDSARRGELYFVEDTSRFFVCRASGWSEIDLRGARGPTGGSGAPGVTGATGVTAATGASSFVQATICSGLLPGIGFIAQYSATVFRSQDVFARGSIRGAAFELTSSAFYAAAQNGAATAVVFLTYDVEGAASSGYFTLELNRTTLVQTVHYHDADAPGGERVWTKPASDCITNVYP